eukprot:evm.model.scf_1034.2 EVM.evm.TU.scf_1034.2   scf_1034:36771-41050(+)
MEVAVMDEGAAPAPWAKPPPLPPTNFGRRFSWGSDSNSARGSPRGLPVSIVLNDTPRSNSIGSAGSPHYLPLPPQVDRGAEDGAKDREVMRSPGRPYAGGPQREVGRSVRAPAGFPTLRSMCEGFYVEPVALKAGGGLGEGNWASVERSEMAVALGAPPRIVAVKRVKAGVLAKGEGMEVFVREFNLMKDHRHKNVVEFIGIGSMDTSTEERMRQSVYIVQEHMDGGSLRDFVLKQMREAKEEVYSKADAFRWLVQVAEGLAFMYERLPNRAHCDVKLENILLTGSTASDMQAKVADFGLTSVFNRNQTRRKVEKFTSNEKSVLFSRQKKLFLKAQSSKILDDDTKGKYGLAGSLPYMAPEVYAASKYSEKADVFSFAIVMYEVLRGRLVLLSLPLDNGAGVIDDHARKVAGGFRPPVPAQWPKAWRDLVAACWAERPEDRPPMSVVAERLKLMVFKGIDEVPKDAPSCCCVVQ